MHPLSRETGGGGNKEKRSQKWVKHSVTSTRCKRTIKNKIITTVKTFFLLQSKAWAANALGLMNWVWFLKHYIRWVKLKSLNVLNTKKSFAELIPRFELNQDFFRCNPLHWLLGAWYLQDQNAYAYFNLTFFSCNGSCFVIWGITYCGIQLEKHRKTNY